MRRDRLVKAAEMAQRVAAAGMGAGRVRIVAQRLVEIGQCLVVLFQAPIHAAALQEGERAVLGAAARRIDQPGAGLQHPLDRFRVEPDIGDRHHALPRPRPDGPKPRRICAAFFGVPIVLSASSAGGKLGTSFRATLTAANAPALSPSACMAWPRSTYASGLLGSSAMTLSKSGSARRFSPSSDKAAPRLM